MGAMGKEVGPSKSSKHSYDNDVEMDEEPDLSSIRELGEETINSFCKKASMLFFDEYGLISHQINSYNEFIHSGLQNVFDSFGDLTVEPGYDPSKKGEGDWRYASVKFGKLTLDQPKFWGGEGNLTEFKMLPRHARLQRMTYSAKMKIDVHVQVKIASLVREHIFHVYCIGLLIDIHVSVDYHI